MIKTYDIMAEVDNSLMKKTKAQLVEIIFRKDSVEQECRTEISNLNKRIKAYDADIEGMIEQSKEDKAIINKQADLLIDKQNLIEDLKSQYDIAATEVANAKEIKDIYETYIKCLGSICVLLVVILIFMLFVF